MGGGGHTGLDQHVLHPRLRTFEARTISTGTEHQTSHCPQFIGQTRHERSFGTDHIEISLEFRGRCGHRTGNARVPRRDHDFVMTTQHGGQRVLTTAGTDDADLHQTLKRRYCSRPGPTPTRPMGTPTCASRATRYASASAGSSSRVVMPEISHFQPGNSSYTGVT